MATVLGLEMTTSRQFGTTPTTAERVLQLERQVVEQGRTIAALQLRLEVLERAAGAADEDGRPEPLGESWKPIKEAAAILGFSQSGLRKHLKRWDENAGYIWWTYRGGRLYVDVDAAPVRVVRT